MDSFTALLPIIIFVVCIIFIVVAIVVGVMAERKRTEALQQIASETGYTFTKDGGTVLAETTAAMNFDLFRRGHSQKVANVLRGRREDFELLAFDFIYVTGHGRNRSTHQQTVTVMKLEQPQLAVFSLRPEGLMDKLASSFGKMDINFEKRPEFSRRYHLTGDDETAVRRLFTDQVIDFCEGQKNLSLEANSSCLALYYTGKKAKPEEWHSLIDTGVNVLAMLRRPTLAGWGDLYDFHDSTGQ